MSLPRYPEYKDSGVAWLGEVPAHWDVSVLRRIIGSIESGVSVNATDTPAATGEFGVLKTSCVYRGEFDPDENKVVVPGEVERVACPVTVGALIVSRMNTPDLVGAAGLVRYRIDNLFLPDRLWQVHFKDANAAFIHYWTKGPSYRAQVQSACAGTSSSMQNLSQDEFRNFYLPIPPVAEQTAIATFLDRETAKIDALIAEQEKLLTLLAEKRQATISHAVTKGLNPDAPMKDSGVEWLEEVPAHWSVFRLGTLFKEVSEPGNDELPVLSVSIHDGVSDKELDETDMDRKVTRSDDRSKYKAVAPGDLTYNMMRAWQGGFGTVTVHGMVSPAYVVARPLREFWTEIVEQQLRTPQAVAEMKRHSRGITDFRLRLYWEEFKTISVALPPVTEQIAISAFVRDESARIDALATEATRTIDLLKERRIALISAAVTGKIDVREAA